MEKLLITICARGGSKGIPKKNIKLLNGKHLIGYSIEHAQNFKNWIEKELQIETTIELSTDSDEFIEVAKIYNLTTTYKRPEELASDNAGKLDAIKDLLLFSESDRQTNYDYILDLDVSAPLRTMDDLIEAWNIFLSNTSALNIFSVNKAHKNPYFNMVEQNDKGFFELSKRAGTILSRQTAPPVFEMNASFYFYKRAFFDQQPMNLFLKALAYDMSHTSFDLDELIDFDFLEYLLQNNKLTFKI